MKVTFTPIVIGAHSHRRIIKRTERLGNRRTSGYHSDFYIVEIRQNTEKSPEDLRRLAVTQTSVKDHQLTLTCKTHKRLIIIIIIIVTEFLLKAALNNAISNNHIKAKIDNMQQKCKFMLCGDRNETFYEITEFKKLIQKECKPRANWVGKVNFAII